MPGLLIMNSSGADAREGESRKRTHDGRLVNGDRSSKNDGGAANGTTPSANTPGAVTSVKGSKASALPNNADERLGLPPEIAEVGPENYRPLSKLYQRMAQECFNSLNDVLRAMANIVPQPNGVAVNGLGGHLNRQADDSELNKQKRKMLLDFAYENRAKFIKLLVLTNWAEEKARPIKKVIDIWSLEQEMSLAYDSIGPLLTDVKYFLNALLREQNPDIKTALQVLSKGTAEWIPDMGFIPPKPLAPEEGLKLLRDINTTIAIRLNVHERLPRHLKKWRIADGRVTFTVDSEFEMDLFTMSEDESEHWQFIDLRFLFSPAPEIDPEGRFLRQFKFQADHILRESGLSGCYDFVHSFVLTHKISTLKAQAYQLSRGTWRGSLKVEPVHRSLIVQYWLERPGKKNWIEIGMSTNKPKNGKISWRGTPVSSLSARWFRDGKEVRDVALGFDYDDLSIEKIMRQTICLHISSILETTRDAIPPRLKMHTSLSKTEPSECFLDVSLGRHDNKTTFSVEPISGRYFLRPSTRVSAQAERAINQFGATTPGTAITQLLTQTMHDSIKRCAELLGWRALPRNTLRTDVVKQATKMDLLHLVILRPTGWSTKWVLAAVIDASGESWWCFELGGQGTVIEHAERIVMEKTGSVMEINRKALASLGRLAIQQLGYHVSKKELRKRGIQCSLRTDLSTAEPSGISSRTVISVSSVALRGWSLEVRTLDLLQSKAGEPQWLDPSIRVVSQGFGSDYQCVSHIAYGTMVKSVATDMQRLMSASSQSNFVFYEDGKFAIHLSTPFGEPIADELTARLRDVDRLRSFATILQKRKMRLMKSSLQCVQFQYGERETATVDFGREDEVKVLFPPENPHNRIIKLLTELVNSHPPFNPSRPEDSGLDRFCEALVLTRPLLSTMEELEKATPGNLYNPAFFIRHMHSYRVTYASPLCSFDIQLRARDDKRLWHIEDNVNKIPDLRPERERNSNLQRPEALKAALGTLFRKPAGREHKWFGVRTGIVAGVDGIADALKALHQAVTSCASEGGHNPVLEVKSEQASPSAQRGRGTMAPSTAVPAAGPVLGNSVQNHAAVQRRNFPNVGRQPQGTKQEVIELD